MLPHLTVRGERRISIPQGELVHMAQSLLSSWDLQNFLFWPIGTLSPSHQTAMVCPHITATCTEFSAGYGGPGQVYSLHPR